MLSAFRKTGIWPLDPSVTLSKISKHTPEPVPKVPRGLRTPLTTKSIRYTQRLFRETENPAILYKLFQANEQLASQHSLDTHLIGGLSESLKHEKKKRKRGKKLNLLGEEASGPQLFSPSRIQKAIEYQNEKESEEAQRQQDIYDRKVIAAAKKVQKEAEKAQRAIERENRRKATAVAKAQKEQEKEAAKRTKKTPIQRPKKQTNRIRVSTDVDQGPEVVQSDSREPESDIAIAVAEEPILVTSRGRQVSRPQRFQL